MEHDSSGIEPILQSLLIVDYGERPALVHQLREKIAIIARTAHEHAEDNHELSHKLEAYHRSLYWLKEAYERDVSCDKSYHRDIMRDLYGK